MIWDFAVAYIAFTFGVAGWNLGLTNSWRTPISLLVATALTQCFYVNLAAWLADQTCLSADTAVFLGYAFGWLCSTLVVEFMLFVFLPLRRNFRVGKVDRFGGATIGLVKAAAVLIFATLASLCAIDFPAPPRAPSIAMWLDRSAQQSQLMYGLRTVALSMPERVVESVVSVGRPSFKPTFQDRTVISADTERTQRIRQLFDALRELQREADTNL